MKYADLIDRVAIGSKNTIRLRNKTSYVDLWWETKDKWFMNVKSKGASDSHWVTEKDIAHYLNFAFFEKGYDKVSIL